MKLVTALLAFALFGMAPARAQTAQPAQAQSSSPSPGQASSTQAAPAQPAAAISENHPVDWAPRQYVELWNTGNLADAHLNSIFNDATTMHSNSGERLSLSAARVKQVVFSWRRSMPDLHFNIEDTVIQGKKVAMRLTFTGTYTKLLWPNTDDPAKFDPPRKIHSTEMLIFSVNNGKIEEIWEEYNEPRMRASMGSGWCTADQRKAATAADKPQPEAPAPAGKP